MHELAMIKNIIELIEKVALDNHAAKVLSAKVKIGELQEVTKENFIFVFKQQARGTLADGARIEIDEVPMVAYCKKCEHEFKPEDHHFMACPKCGQNDIEVLSGRDVILESIEVE
ncbi:MAG: hydrogenase maturation nickel metallochaperone HypA [bacterium]